MKKKTIFITLLFAIFIFFTTEVFPQEESSENNKFAVEYQLDPYYTAVDLYVNLTNKPIPEVGEKSEIEVYKDLLLSSYFPRFLLLEASVNPMPVLGVYIKDRMPDFFDSATLSNDVNIIQAITEGFEEPYAISFFLGDVVQYKRRGQNKAEGNKGYQGILFSYGNRHIKDSVMIRDDWYEIEWKIKGDRAYEKRKLNWSFRVGSKLHMNEEIKDVIYISLRRSRLDLTDTSGSIFKNSGFEYTYEMEKNYFYPIRHYFLLEKKWPIKNLKVAFSLVFGLVWDKKNKYTGRIKEKEQSKDSFLAIIRPNLAF